LSTSNGGIEARSNYQLNQFMQQFEIEKARRERVLDMLREARLEGTTVTVRQLLKKGVRTYRLHISDLRVAGFVIRERIVQDADGSTLCYSLEAEPGSEQFDD
jgi:hypothetical protein